MQQKEHGVTQIYFGINIIKPKAAVHQPENQPRTEKDTSLWTLFLPPAEEQEFRAEGLSQCNARVLTY